MLYMGLLQLSPSGIDNYRVHYTGICHRCAASQLLHLDQGCVSPPGRRKSSSAPGITHSRKVTFRGVIRMGVISQIVSRDSQGSKYWVRMRVCFHLAFITRSFFYLEKSGHPLKFCAIVHQVPSSTWQPTAPAGTQPTALSRPWDLCTLSQYESNPTLSSMRATANARLQVCPAGMHPRRSLVCRRGCVYR